LATRTSAGSGRSDSSMVKACSFVAESPPAMVGLDQRSSHYPTEEPAAGRRHQSSAQRSGLDNKRMFNHSAVIRARSTGLPSRNDVALFGPAVGALGVLNEDTPNVNRCRRTPIMVQPCVTRVRPLALPARSTRWQRNWFGGETRGSDEWSGSSRPGGTPWDSTTRSQKLGETLQT